MMDVSRLGQCQEIKTLICLFRHTNLVLGVTLNHDRKRAGDTSFLQNVARLILSFPGILYLP